MAEDDRVKELPTHMEKLVDLLERRNAEQGKRMDRLETVLETMARSMTTPAPSLEKMKSPATPASPIAVVPPVQYGDTSSTAHAQQ